MKWEGMRMEAVLNSYLELGLTALARGGQHNWFDGHFGAALLAAYYMNKEHDLPDHVQGGLIRTCEHYRAQHPEWFVPVEGETADLALLARVIEGLRLNTARLSTSGHGLALGVLGLKALLERPDFLLPSIVEGLYRTLERTAVDRPDRYYGVEDYFSLPVAEDTEIMPYASVQEMVERAFAEIGTVVPTMRWNGKLYHFTGELEHGITHAQALVELDRLGYAELAAQGMVNHRKQMVLNRLRPQEVLVYEVVEPPFSSIFAESYWAGTYDDPHAIKVPYAAWSLLKRLPEEQRAVAEFHLCKILGQMK
jgi:hypothetical protein